MSDDQDFSEDNLIQALRDGDRKAMRYVYKIYWPMIQRFVCLNSGTSEDAEDVYQDGFIVLSEKIKDKNFVLSCKLKVYLYSVCRKTWLNRIRPVQKPVDIEKYINILPEDLTEELERPTDEAVWNAVVNLADPCKAILISYYYEKMSLELIATNMKYPSANGAKVQKFRCVERLKKVFLPAKTNAKLP